MDVASFVCAGDVMINRPEPGTMLRHVASYFKAADAAYVNFEGPACDVGKPHPDMSAVGIHIRSTPKAPAALKEAGINVVSLANNHALDYGSAGLMQTIVALEKLKIGYAGAGPDLASARCPAMLTVKGIKVAILSYTSVCVASFAAKADKPGVAMIRIDTSYEANLRLLMQPGSPMVTRTHANADDVAMLKEDIRAAKSKADVVIVAWHWGVSERWGRLAEYQRKLAHLAIDEGADVILGHHAHMLHGMEFYKGRPIFYSLGNFAFDMEHPYFRSESAIVRFQLAKSGVSDVQIIPVAINGNHEPEPVTALDAITKMGWLLEQHSEGLNSRFLPRPGYLEMVPLS